MEQQNLSLRSQEYQHAYENKNKIIAYRKHVAKATMALAHELYECSTNSLWRNLGYDTFEEMLADPEVSVGRSMAFDLIRIYRIFVVELKMPEDAVTKIDVSKLRQLVAIDQMLGTQQQAMDWLQKAEVLSKSDLKIELQKAQGKTIEENPRVNTNCMIANTIIVARVKNRDYKQAKDWAVLPQEGQTPVCRMCGSVGSIGKTDDVLLQGPNMELKVVECKACHRQDLLLFVRENVIPLPQGDGDKK